MAKLITQIVIFASISFLSLFIELTTTTATPSLTAIVKRDVYDEKKFWHVLVAVPTNKGYWYNNPFELTRAGVEPLVDMAVEEVYRRQYLPRGSLRVHYVDTNASDAVGPWRAVEALTKNELDVVIGYGNVYALVPVARMSWLFKNGAGVPLITSIGLNDVVDDRRIYKLLTRMSGSYRYLGHTYYPFSHQMKWNRYAYLIQSNIKYMRTYGRTECYGQLLSIRNYELDQMRRKNLTHQVDMDALVKEFDPAFEWFGTAEYEKLLADISMMANSKTKNQATFDLCVCIIV